MHRRIEGLTLLSVAAADGPSRDGDDASEDAPFTLLGDQPYELDRDPLGFDALVSDLADLVLESRGSTPFTLGLDAGWGMGKSSLMRKLRSTLDGYDNVTTVWFNAWTSEGNSVLEGLIKSVLDRIDPNILRRSLRRQHLVRGFRLTVTVVASVLRLGNLVDRIWERISIDPRARNEMAELMKLAMSDWMARSRQPQGRVLVVFVDDLDRCSPASVFQVFEAIKLYLDTSGFVFVLGYDSSIISEAILEEKKYSKQITSRDYLEKIIQIGYRIPIADDEHAKALVEEYLDSSNTSHLFDDSLKALVVDRNDRNPRRIKRFINGFILQYGLDRDWAELGAANLVKVEILRVYFPDFARLLGGSGPADTITEFLEYVETRTFLRQELQTEGPRWGRVSEVLASHHVAIGPDGETPRSHRDLLHALEQELPEAFPAAVQDANFVALLQSFPPEADRGRLREKLEGRYVPLFRPSRLVLRTDGGGDAKEFNFAGVKLLWIDDKPERNAALAAAIEQFGGEVHSVGDFEGAAELLRSGGAIDVVIAEMSGRGSNDAGLGLVGRLQEERLFRCALVFYTARVTPARRDAAAKLGALGVTNDPSQLLTLLTRALAAPLATESPVPAEKVRRGRSRTSAHLPRVYISYRREDSSGYAGRLYDQLASRAQRGTVFRDVDSIAPGVDFSQAVRSAVLEADALVVVIGLSWLDGTDGSGRRRLDNPDDFIRLDIAAALTSNMLVIPVLVEGAAMPRPDELPTNISDLARRNAVELSDERWTYDVDRLVDVLENFAERTA